MPQNALVGWRFAWPKWPNPFSAVNKKYVDDSIAAVTGGAGPAAGARFVNVSGDEMRGPLAFVGPTAFSWSVGAEPMGGFGLIFNFKQTVKDVFAPLCAFLPDMLVYSGWIEAHSKVGDSPILSTSMPGFSSSFVGRKFFPEDRTYWTRWRITVGDASPETGDNAGSNFVISRTLDDGRTTYPVMTIERATGKVEFPGGIDAGVF